MGYAGDMGDADNMSDAGDTGNMGNTDHEGNMGEGPSIYYVRT